MNPATTNLIKLGFIATGNTGSLKVLRFSSERMRRFTWIAVIVLLAPLLMAQRSAQDTLGIGVGSQNVYQPEDDAAQRDAAQVDQALQHNVQQQLATSTSFQNVEVHVSKGVAHLKGPVPSQGDKKRAVDLVNAVPGVTNVNEDLTVDARAVGGATATADADSNAKNPATPGAALASQIAIAMHDEPSLANSQVYVTVKGDVIELTGTVPGKKERRKAKEVASAFAINQHVVNKLTIAPRNEARH